MAKFRKIHTAFWDDPLIEKLSPDTRYFYLFLMTNPLCTECGIYQISIKKMCNYTGYNEDAIKALIRILEVENKRIIYSLKTDEICLLKKPNYIDNTGKPVLDCLKSELSLVKNVELIKNQLKHIDKQLLINFYEDNFTTRTTTRQIKLNDTSTEIGQEEEEEKEEEKEKELLAPIVFQINEVQIGAIKELIGITKKAYLDSKQIIGLWDTFLVQNGNKHKKLDDAYSHFMNWVKYQNFTSFPKTTEEIAKTVKINL